MAAAVAVLFLATFGGSTTDAPPAVEIIASLDVVPSGELESPSATYYGTCTIEFDLINRARWIQNVFTECDCGTPFFEKCGSRSDDCHVCNWGNWGVQSNYGGLQNGTQFRGWHFKSEHGDQRYMWNSCTSQYQQSLGYPWDTRSWGGYTEEYRVDAELACTDMENQGVDISSVWMEMKELDAFNHDEVNTLTYPATSFTPSCTEDECWGESGWYNPSNPGNGKCGAMVAAQIVTSWYDPY